MQPFWKLYKASSCSLKLKGTTAEAVFRELITVMVKSGALPEDKTDATLEALLAREEKASTGVGQHVAIPHVQIEGIDEAIVSLGIHPQGVAWNSLDGEPAQIFFVVLRPTEGGESHDPDRHLEMMRWIASLGRDADFRNFARAATTRTELVQLLKEMSGAAN
ncbi:MAG: PTS sugar transporter subunit IIA [Planctomycetota bacterium]